MSAKFSTSVVIAMALIGATAIADQSRNAVMPTYSAVYRVEHDNRTVGTSQVSVSFDELQSTYRYYSQTRLTGAYKLLMPDALVASSEFTVRDGIVVPLQYTHKGGRRNNQEVSITFDWESLEALTQDRTIGLSTGALDPAILNVASMLDLVRQGTAGPYVVIDETGLKTTYEVSVDKTAAIDHPLVASNTIRVSYSRDGTSRATTTWVAPGLCYLPVRIERESGGLETTLVLESVEGLSDVASACPDNLSD